MSSVSQPYNLVICSPDSCEQTIKTVFIDNIPVVHFNINNANERKLAVIELVEQGLCNQKIAGKLCGFHRNTVFKILRTKRFLGIEAVLIDDRGHKEPYKYINEVRSYIKKLLRKYPDRKDQDIADQAAKELDMEISRSAVARIRTEGHAKPAKIPCKQKLLDTAKLAETIVKERSDKRQLWLNFDTEPELKQKAEECAKKPLPHAKGEAQQALVDQLQQGKPCAFAGGFMHHLFLQEIDFSKIMSAFPHELKTCSYSA